MPNKLSGFELAAYGVLEKAFTKERIDLHPFSRHESIMVLFEGKVDVVRKIVQRIDQLNNRIAYKNAGSTLF